MTSLTSPRTLAFCLALLLLPLQSGAQRPIERLFMEDARSFATRVGLVDEYGLRGFSVWVLGSEDPAIWDVLRAR